MVLLAVVLVIAGVIFYGQKIKPFINSQTNISPTVTNIPTPTISPIFEEERVITITNPEPNQVIKSPLEISGKAPGNWFFEGQAPVKLTDENGKTIAEGQIKTQDDWMTTNLVPFIGKLTFEKPKTDTGILVLQNDNPSGNPETSQKVEILIRFR